MSWIMIFRDNVHVPMHEGGNIVSKASKSKRFTQQSVDAVKKHDERFPYRSRFSEAQRKQEDAANHTVGGF